MSRVIEHYPHRGVTYEFEPPVETGGKIIESLAEVATIAYMNKKTPELGGSGEEMIEEQIDLMISAADGSNGQKAHPNIVADSLSKLLEGHHKVTAKPY